MRKASDTCLNVNRVRFTFNGILLKFGDERMELSQKLKELRKKQGLTQLELAERLFVSRQAISGWEAGTSRPSTENLQSLSKLYNVPLEMLLDDAEAAGPEPEKIPEEERPEKEKHEPGPDKARRKDDKKKKRLDSEYLPAQSISCFDAWLYCVSVGEGSFYRAIYPIVICLPYIFTFYTDQNSTFIYFLLSRESYRDYLKNKCFSGCISTISLVLGVNIVWLIVAYILFPANKPITIFNLQMGGIYNWLYPNSPLVYIWIQIAFSILFSIAFFAVSGLLAFLSNKKWQTAVLPFAIYFLSIFLSQFFDEPFLNPVSYLIPYETSKLSISNILFGDMMLLLIGAGGIFFYYIKRKEEVLWI